MRSNLVDIDIQLIHRTEKAVLVISGDTGVEAWVPLSQCEISEDNKTLTLEQSCAEDKRLV